MDIKRIRELAGIPKGPKAVKKVITSITGEVGGIRLSEEVDFKHLARTHGADVSIKDIKGVCIGVVTFNEGSAEESKEKLAAFRAAWKQLLSGETPIDSINEAKQRKTSDEYTIQGYYSGSWEDVTTEETSKGAKDRIKEYRANEAGVSFRMIKRRVKNESVENVNEAKNDVLYVLYVGEKGSGKLGQQFSDESSAACHQEYKDSWCNDHDSDGKKIKYSHKVVKQSPGETLPMKIDESFKLNEGLVYGECMECNEPSSVRAVKDSSNNYVPDPSWKCENCGAVDAFNEEHPDDRNDRDMYEGACPLKGHAYHDKSDAELEYICKDASEAAKNMKGMNDTAEGKYLDQANDASTILHYRKKKAVKEGYNKEDSNLNRWSGKEEHVIRRHQVAFDKLEKFMKTANPYDWNTRNKIDLWVDRNFENHERDVVYDSVKAFGWYVSEEDMLKAERDNIHQSSSAVKEGFDSLKSVAAEYKALKSQGNATEAAATYRELVRLAGSEGKAKEILKGKEVVAEGVDDRVGIYKTLENIAMLTSRNRSHAQVIYDSKLRTDVLRDAMSAMSMINLVAQGYLAFDGDSRAMEVGLTKSGLDFMRDSGRLQDYPENRVLQGMPNQNALIDVVKTATAAAFGVKKGVNTLTQSSVDEVKESDNNFLKKHSEDKPMPIMGLQEPNDLNNRMGVDKDRADKVEVPSDVRSAVSSRIAELKKSIEEYDDKGYNDISQKEKCIECLEKTMEHLSKGDVEGLKQAQIYFATLMSPITEFFPAKLITFLGNADARKAGWLDRFKVTEGVGYSERRGIVRNRDARNDMNTELGAVGKDDSDPSMFPDEDHEPSDTSWESSYGSCFDDGDDGDTPEGFYEYTVECPQCHNPNSITPAHLQYAPDPKCVECMRAE